MGGYIENNYKAIIQPLKDIHLTNGSLLKELEYLLSRQREPVDNKKGMKRSFIQGNGYVGWIGFDIESNFKIIKVLRK